MATVFIFHGIGGSPEENWFPWLRSELNDAGHRAIVPAFPNSETPNLNEWINHMDQYRDSIDDQTVFVGHSLGSMFAVRLLETMATPIHGTFLVASVTNPKDGLDFAPLMTSFTVGPFDWKKIRKNGGKFHVLHADNDPYIQLPHAEELARNLGVTVEMIPGAGHINASAGFREFPHLRDEILAQV